MATILITGSADGLGLLAAKQLLLLGHEVTLHARNTQRAEQAMENVPGANCCLVADLSSMAATKALASEANEIGRFDVVIHNAGIYQVPKGSVGAEGLPLLLTVNTLAPYILTAMMHQPQRLIYMSSGMHIGGNSALAFEAVTYADTKLHDLILAKAVARMFPEICANAIDPGWVPTKMGGVGAPDSLQKGYETQVWLAVSADAAARVSGRYFHHQREARSLDYADDFELQERFLARCEQITGVTLG